MSIHGVLGEATSYPKTYSPNILYPISRQLGRDEITNQTGFVFGNAMGVDVWQAFELSWLNPIGVSQVAMARITIPASSPNIVESKSLKLYLNSLNFTKFNHSNDVQSTLQQDLSLCVGADVMVELIGLDGDKLSLSEPMGLCIDGVLTHYDGEVLLTDDINNGFLKNTPKSHLTTHQFYSHLLRSNCPVTNQPDWGTVQINITTDHQIDYGKILQYFLSFRQHNGFHEQCVERIFADFMVHFSPQSLSVLANYTRRGGIDINPIRVFNTRVEQVKRLIRQ